jgi:hypothetical protein
MRLTRIEADNLKGNTFAYDLSSAVAIIGPNFAGKTRVIDAIRLALLGYLPELGKTNRATWGLASGSPMIIKGTVGATWDHSTGNPIAIEPTTDILITRRFWMEGSVIKDQSDIEALSKRFEPRFDYFQFAANPMLNASLYFSMSERERTNYVFRVSPLPKNLSVPSIIKRLEWISFEEKHTEAIEKAKREIIARVAAEFEGATNLADTIDSVIESLKVTYAVANRRQKDTIGAVRILTELKNRENDVGQPPADKDIAVAQAEFDEAQQKVGAIRLRADAARDYKERQSDVLFGENEGDWAADIDKTMNLIAEARGALVLDPENIENDIGEKQWIYNGLLHDRRTLTDDLERLNGESTSFSRLKECPTCGTKGKNWRDTVSNRLASKIKTAAEKLSTLDDRIAATKRELDSLNDRHVAGNTVRARNATHRENIKKWTEQVEAIKQRHYAWNAQLSKLRADLAKLPQVTMPSDDETLTVTKAAANARVNLDELIDRRAQYESYQHDLKRAAQAAQEHHEAKARLTVTKAVLEALQTIKTEVVDAAFGGLLKIANTVVGNVLKTPLAFYNGEVGRWDGSKFIGHGTFSGTEQALTFVAIATALAQQSPLRILIFDELGRLDYARQHDVTFLLKEALDKGLIDQFIIAGALKREVVSLAGGLQIIELE